MADPELVLNYFQVSGYLKLETDGPFSDIRPTNEVPIKTVNWKIFHHQLIDINQNESSLRRNVKWLNGCLLKIKFLPINAQC